MVKVDYGVDAPGVIRNLFVAAAICLIVPFIFPMVTIGPVIIDMHGLLWASLSCGLGGVLMLVYVKYGKFRHRDAMLAMVKWRGNEQVLDIGTGRGLLLIGAAKHLQNGIATGIDIWNTQDLSNNAEIYTLHNAKAEGVEGKVRVLSMDAQKLDFPDESFDVILSNVCLHNIPDKAGRKNACMEIARVLRKGGTGLISDFKNIREYRDFFKEAGLTVSLHRGSILTTLPPLITIRLQK
jgi:SAM-dependent methyltransferase